MRARLLLRSAALAALAVLGSSAAAWAEPRVEYQIQAAYVSKFLRFVEWPDANLPDERFRVGVVGDAEFREALAALDGYAVGERSVEVENLEGPGAIGDLHVLVIGPSPSGLALDFLLRAREQPILTVSDAADFSDNGGIIQFVVVEDAVRFQVNVASAERVGISVSSRLLRLATEVRRRWSP